MLGDRFFSSGFYTEHKCGLCYDFVAASCRLAYGLRLLNLANNKGLTGSIPNVAGLLNHLREAELYNNSLSCAGEVTPGVPPPVCSDEELLPCFLKFGDRFVPLQDNSFLQCKPIMRRDLLDGYENCNETASPDVKDGTMTIQEEELMRQQWQLDPSYYQYKTCKCLEVSEGAKLGMGHIPFCSSCAALFCWGCSTPF